MKLILTALLFLSALLPAQADIGKPIATVLVAEGALTVHERGMTLRYLDGSTLTTSLIGVPPVLTASWRHDTGAGIITVTAEYEFPVPNPTKAQRALYAARFKDIVKETLAVFPANVP